MRVEGRCVFGCIFLQSDVADTPTHVPMLCGFAEHQQASRYQLQLAAQREEQQQIRRVEYQRSGMGKTLVAACYGISCHGVFCKQGVCRRNQAARFGVKLTYSSRCGLHEHCMRAVLMGAECHLSGCRSYLASPATLALHATVAGWWCLHKRFICFASPICVVHHNHFDCVNLWSRDDGRKRMVKYVVLAAGRV